MDLKFTTHVPEKKKKNESARAVERNGGLQTGAGLDGDGVDFEYSAGGGSEGLSVSGGGRVAGAGSGFVGGGGHSLAGGRQVNAAAAINSSVDDTFHATHLVGGGRVHRKTTNEKAGQPQALTEFALHSPEIEAEMDADQFSALSDVIGSIFLAQLADPPPRPIVAATALLAIEGRSLVEGEERASAAVVAGPLAASRLARWAAAAVAADIADARVFASAGFAGRGSMTGKVFPTAAAAEAIPKVYPKP